MSGLVGSIPGIAMPVIGRSTTWRVVIAPIIGGLISRIISDVPIIGRSASRIVSAMRVISRFIISIRRMSVSTRRSASAGVIIRVFLGSFSNLLLSFIFLFTFKFITITNCMTIFTAVATVSSTVLLKSRLIWVIGCINFMSLEQLCHLFHLFLHICKSHVARTTLDTSEIGGDAITNVFIYYVIL